MKLITAVVSTAVLVKSLSSNSTFLLDLLLPWIRSLVTANVPCLRQILLRGCSLLLSPFIPQMKNLFPCYVYCRSSQTTSLVDFKHHFKMRLSLLASLQASRSHYRNIPNTYLACDIFRSLSYCRLNL